MECHDLGLELHERGRAQCKKLGAGCNIVDLLGEDAESTAAYRSYGWSAIGITSGKSEKYLK